MAAGAALKSGEQMRKEDPFLVFVYLGYFSWATNRKLVSMFVYRARFNAVSGRTYRGDTPFKDRIKFMFCS